MGSRLPRKLFPVIRADNPAAALEYEIAQEKASALGRLGRQLEAALATLAAFDAAGGAQLTPEDRARRKALVAEAGQVLWYFIVQREACGLRDSRQVMRDYAVPNEVRNCMGMFPARPVPPPAR